MSMQRNILNSKMENDKIRPGTMLYDVDRQMLGWVVGKHQWTSGFKISYSSIGTTDATDDWDIQWSNGKQEHWDKDSLQYFINAYIMLEEDNDKR